MLRVGIDTMAHSIGYRPYTRLAIWMRRHRFLPRVKRDIYPVSAPDSPDAPVRDGDGLPPPPDYILAHRVVCEMPILHRRVKPDGDNSLDFVPLDSFDNTKASEEFKDKNILIWQPHIHFL